MKSSSSGVGRAVGVEADLRGGAGFRTSGTMAGRLGPARAGSGIGGAREREGGWRGVEDKVLWGGR